MKVFTSAALIAVTSASPLGMVLIKKNSDLSVAESAYHYPAYHSAGHKHGAYGHHLGAHGMHHGGHYGHKDHYADGGYGMGINFFTKLPIVPGCA